MIGKALCYSNQLLGAPESTPVVEEETYYGLPWWRQLIWSILFVSMATTATCGNLIVIWIVLWHQRMRTVTNYFLLNLSLADISITLFCTLNQVMSTLSPDYFFTKI